MLARVASNLYWIGRYIERTEHIARYLNVNYFNSLDANHPISSNREFVMESMLFMVGEDPFSADISKLERDVLYNIVFNPESEFSILSIMTRARENARNSMEMISSDLWLSINQFYHFLTEYDVELFLQSGLYDFTKQVNEHCNIVRGRIKDTLLHDEAYSMILIGMYIERATQVGRIINTKYNDTLKIQHKMGESWSESEVSYEWTILLKCVECFDMIKRNDKQFPNVYRTLDFLVFNENCPRSITHSLLKVKEHIERISNAKNLQKDSLEFSISKLTAEYVYLNLEDVEDNLLSFIKKTLDNLNHACEQIEKEFFFHE